MIYGRFLVGDLDDFRLRFERDASGNVIRLIGMYNDGNEEPSARGGEEPGSRRQGVWGACRHRT